MTEEEYQKRLEELGVVIEEFNRIPDGRSARFKHPLMDTIKGVGYSQAAIDDLKALHNIDSGPTVRTETIKLLEERLDLAAIRLIENGDANAFFEHYNFEFLEELTKKYPRVAKIVANPDWKPSGANQQ